MNDRKKNIKVIDNQLQLNMVAKVVIMSHKVKY